jgi:hypothetical protein
MYCCYLTVDLGQWDKDGIVIDIGGKQVTLQIPLVGREILTTQVHFR